MVLREIGDAFVQSTAVDGNAPAATSSVLLQLLQYFMRNFIEPDATFTAHLHKHVLPPLERADFSRTAVVKLHATLICDAQRTLVSVAASGSHGSDTEIDPIFTSTKGWRLDDMQRNGDIRCASVLSVCMTLRFVVMKSIRWLLSI